jgi:GntR family transcriptional regulator
MLTKDLFPLHYQLSNILRNQIISGELMPGAKLPTENELVKKYGVSRLTVRKAKEKLIEEGLIHSIQGSGSYLTEPEMWKLHPFTIESIDDILTLGKEMAFKIHEFRMVPNTEENAKKLKNPHDRFIFQIIGVRYFQGRSISYVHYHLPFALGSRIPVGLLNENPFIPQFEKLAGIQVTEGVQSIFSSRASHGVAKNLGVLEGSPVLVMETLYFDPHGQPIEFVKAQYREEFRYNIRVTRRKMDTTLPTLVL